MDKGEAWLLQMSAVAVGGLLGFGLFTLGDFIVKKLRDSAKDS